MPGLIPDAIEHVRERGQSQPPSWVHGAWVEAFPWLVQGTTTRGSDRAPFDLGLFSDGSPEEAVREHWSVLRDATGAEDVVHARQVHGAEVRVHGPRRSPGVGEPHRLGGVARAGGVPRIGALPRIVGACDGHVTSEPGLLLAVTTADCVPVFVVDPERRAIGMLHAGWRGTAAGILERGLGAMGESFDSDPQDLRLHLGPAICGRCYEVGPEVFEALDRPVPEAATPIDLREVLAARAIGQGVQPSAVSVSAHCTRCTDSDLFSHRGGDAFRQVGYLGIRP